MQQITDQRETSRRTRPESSACDGSFPLHLLQVTALSVAIAFVYVRTNGSLLLTMLMHAAVNQSKDIVPSAVAGSTSVFGLSHSRTAWMTVALLWIGAAYFLVRLRGASHDAPALTIGHVASGSSIGTDQVSSGSGIVPPATH